MALRVGQPVPDHSMQAYVRGERSPSEFDLSSHRGKWVVLFFYPRDFTLSARPSWRRSRSATTTSSASEP
jgi:alkyl hydroperoxide reductase subunit AhpC